MFILDIVDDGKTLGVLMMIVNDDPVITIGFMDAVIILSILRSMSVDAVDDHVVQTLVHVDGPGDRGINPDRSLYLLDIVMIVGSAAVLDVSITNPRDNGAMLIL